jgi:hypothetical protein
VSARCGCPGGNAVAVATAKEERGDSAIELLALLKRRHLMHAPAPRRTSSSGSRCSACVRTGVSAGRAGVAGGVAVALITAAEGWKRAGWCATDSANTRKP